MSKEFYMFDKDFWVLLLNIIFTVIILGVLALLFAYIFGVFKQDNRILLDNPSCHKEVTMNDTVVLLCEK